MFNKTTFFERASGLFAQKSAQVNARAAKHKIIATIGLTRDEVTVLASMVAIVAIRTQGEWRLGGIDNADIFFVNVESKEGNRFVRRHDGQLPIIKYGKNKEESGLVKPLRARDLLEAFKAFTLRDAAELKNAGGNMLKRSA